LLLECSAGHVIGAFKGAVNDGPRSVKFDECRRLKSHGVFETSHRKDIAFDF